MVYSHNRNRWSESGPGPCGGSVAAARDQQDWHANVRISVRQVALLIKPTASIFYHEAITGSVRQPRLLHVRLLHVSLPKLSQYHYKLIASSKSFLTLHFYFWHAIHSNLMFFLISLHEQPWKYLSFCKLTGNIIMMTVKFEAEGICSVCDRNKGPPRRPPLPNVTLTAEISRVGYVVAK